MANETVAVISTVRTLQAALAVVTGLQLTGWMWPATTTVANGDTFDFIIVGAGSGGSVIANRLTEIENLNVLLIEAGGDPPIESVLPGIFTMQPNTAYDFNFTSENDGYTSQNLKNHVVGLTAGKMLGGSSSLHHMIHVRGNMHDYDGWVTASGDESWSYENLLEYFMKSEKVEDDEILNSSGAQFQGTDGYMRLKRQPSDQNEPIFAAFKELGYEKVLNSNEHTFTVGISEPLLNIADGIRQSAAETYLRPISGRSNFKLLKETTVTRVLFDGNKAIGVEAVTSSGETIELYANHEVILSAGALVTPKILMLSGIGPSDHLSSFGIDVKADLPVGKNLQDHIPAIVVTKLQEGDALTTPANPHLFPVPTTTAYSALDQTQGYSDYQTINLIFPPDSTALLQFCSIVFSYSDNVCQSLFDGAAGRYSLFTVLNMMQPLSKGEVLLRSSDPEDAPLVKHGIYSNETDLDNMASYLQDFAAIVNTNAFKNFNAEIVDVDLAECADLEKYSNEYWRCYALGMSATMWHYGGTCAMGSVVDNQLKVKGVQNLRVVDASAMPNTISGNINAGVVVLAEKAADLIKQYHGASPRI